LRGVLPKDPVFFSGTRAFRRGIYCSSFRRWVTRLHLPQKTLRNKFALAAASIVAALLVAEIAACGWAFAQGQPYSAECARESIREIVTQMTAELPGVEGETETPARKEALFTLHPYSGYDSGLGLKITERAVAHFHDPDAKSFTIFVHGGSVAAIFAGIQRGALDVVTQQLAEHPSVARPVRVFRMATAGFKQHLCEPRGILYLHVIQPTLHDPGSKLITPAEREKGIGTEGMDPDVVKGYEMMRARVEELKGAGVTVLDATRIFADNAETLYYDNCHVGRKVNAILAEHIYTTLAETLE
jgi:hypothetical protein